MKQIGLAFGGFIYIEEFGEQEEEDRIKIYDSDKKYLDYFPLDLFQDVANREEVSAKEVLDEWGEEMSGCLSVEDLLDYLNTDWEAIFPNESAAMHILDIDAPELDNSEWINHIGKYYIKIYEY